MATVLDVSLMVLWVSGWTEGEVVSKQLAHTHPV